MHPSLIPYTPVDSIEGVFIPEYDFDAMADKYHVRVTQIFPEDPDLDLPALPPKPPEFCQSFRPGKQTLAGAYQPKEDRRGQNIDVWG